MVCTFLLVLAITVGIDSLRINGLLGRHCLSRPQPRSKLSMTVDDKVESSFYRDLALLSTKALDTVEDAVLHFRRTFLPSYQESATLEWMQNTAFKGRRHKARVVVVGSGWAAHAFLKICETDGYEVVCVSPRPYFVFTPMLASTAVGTVEYRSIVEPIRQANPAVLYVEAEVTDLSLETKTLVVNASKLRPEGGSFAIPYDYLVYAAGAQVNDFGLEGVVEHCSFIKEIDDVRKIKTKILDNFELASLPSTSEDQLSELLTFAVVGGGPTGVEFAGELTDFISDELKILYPHLAKYIRIVLVNSGASILNAFDSALQARAIETLRLRGIELKLNAKVTRMEKNRLFYQAKNVQSSSSSSPSSSSSSSLQGQNEEEEMEVELRFGLCVWAAGTASRKITQVLAERMGSLQTNSVAKTGKLLVDPWLRIQGLPSESFGSILAMGDASLISEINKKEGVLPQTAQVAAQQGAYAARLFNRRYRFGSVSAPSIPESPEALQEFSKDTEAVTVMSTAAADRNLFFYRTRQPLQADNDVGGTTSSSALMEGGSTSTSTSTTSSSVIEGGSTSSVLTGGGSATSTMTEGSGTGSATIGGGTGRPLIEQDDLTPINTWSPAQWSLVHYGSLARVRSLIEAKPFEFLNLGLLAYVGAGQAVAQVQLGDNSLLNASGENAFLLWRSVYLVKQVSTRTRLLVLFDFVKSKLFGRDLTSL